MNREFQFRAWDSKNKIFAFKEFHIIGECTAFNLLQQYRIEEFNDLFITQFIGLKDKNGKEIHEGDILECPMPKPGQDGFKEMEDYAFDWWERGIVKYYNEYARFGLEFYSPYGGEGYTGLEQHISEYLSNKDDNGWWLIGNIFENSELICKNFTDEDWQTYSEKRPVEKQYD